MIRASREGEKPEVDPATGMPVPFASAALQKRSKEMMPQPVGKTRTAARKSP